MTDSDVETGPQLVERCETLVAGPSVALSGLLDIEPPVRRDGDTLPVGWHWVYLLEKPRQDDLGTDGHPMHGIPAPPGPGMQRMFAGGQVTTVTPLRIGAEVARETSVIASTKKQGRSGPLSFITVRSAFNQDGQLAIVDEQEVVYRSGRRSHFDRTSKDATPEIAADDSPLRIDVDPILLFRFSALTYNAHRIHYDLEYARREGYPDLVIHGPLQALLMIERLRRGGVTLVGRQFKYRLLAPAYGSGQISVSRDLSASTVEVSVHDQTGVRTASGSVTHPGSTDE